MAASSWRLLLELQHMVADQCLLRKGFAKRNDNQADCLRAGALSIRLEPSKTIMPPVPPSQLPSQQSPGSVQSKVSSC